jgi:hypothetical protein
VLSAAKLPESLAAKIRAKQPKGTSGRKQWREAED